MSIASKSEPPTGNATKPGPANDRARSGSTMLSLGRRFLTLREGSIIVVTVITLVYFSLTVTNFLTVSNFKTLLPYFCFLAIMAAGEVFVMVLGEIDLSVGALYLFVPFVYWKFTTWGLGLVPSVILSLLVGGVAGGINGFFVAYVRVPSFVVTLAMLFFLDGVTLIMSHSQQLTMPGTQIIGESTFANVLGAGTYSELLWAIGIVVVLQVLLSTTRWGLYTVAAGGNRIGAAEAGINVRLVVLRNFVLAAVCAGFSGILEAVRTSSLTPDPSGSNADLLLAVAAVIIGGTVMTGGEGTVVGALIGALFLGILNDGLVVKGVSANYEDMYLGLAVLVAMTINVYVRRARQGAGRG